MTLDKGMELRSHDRRVMRAAEAYERARTQLRTPEQRNAAKESTPFEGMRDVAGQDSFKAIRSLQVAPHDNRLRDAVLRWVHELLQARISWQLVVDEAHAVELVDPTTSPALARARAGALSPESVTSSVPLITFDEARRAFVDSRSAPAADIAFRRMEELAKPVVAVRNEMRARRFEAAKRLGLEHPWSLATTLAPAKLEAYARSVLEVTDPLSADLIKEVRKRSGSQFSACRTIFDSFGRDAKEGWPAKLSARWLDGVFRSLAPRPPRDVGTPEAIGGASFLRAAVHWGRMLRLESAPSAMPFSLSRDPYPTEAWLFGYVLASVVASPAFATRKLALSAAAASDHARALGMVQFFALRMRAGEVLSAMRTSPRDEDIDEVALRVFGAPLPRQLSRLWAFGGFSGQSRVDGVARLLATLRSHAFAKSMIERFDEDWFDNPRGRVHFTSTASAPVWSAEVPDIDAIRIVGRSFEGLLG